MKNLLSLLLVLFSFTTVLSQNGNDRAGQQNNDPKNLSVAQYNERIAASTKLVLVYFKADWCVVCKKQKPLLDAVMAEHKNNVELLELNMEDNPLIAEFFEVDGLPVTILYKHGKIVWDRMGLTEKSELEAQIHFFEK